MSLHGSTFRLQMGGAGSGGRISTTLPLHHLLLLLLPLVLMQLAPAPVQGSVMGIDFGEEWFKVSIVKPGVPLDIVLNKESKRKTAALVQVRQDVRVFGNDALSLDTYPAMKSLLGKKFDDPAAQAYRTLYSNNMVNTSRGTIAFQEASSGAAGTPGKDTPAVYTVEELVAMQLAHAKGQAELYGNEAVSGVVMTIPPYANVFERRALLDAAEIAGLRVLTLMNDETAVALNYAMTRNFPEAQYTIFYDMGAGSTVASLVKFDSIVKRISKKSNKTTASLAVQSVGYDASLGGHAFDQLILEHLGRAFEKKHPAHRISANPKARTKLLREATRVKQILSANQEVTASIEGLVDDIDFRLKVTRTELEEMAKPLLKRVSGPVLSVIQDSGLKMSDIHSLVLVGGSVRIPCVQAVLRNLAGEEKIAKNINGDEAAVLGAGFRAAGISTQFRVREIKVKDITLDPVRLVYQAEGSSNGATKALDTLLIARHSKVGAKKLMNFKRRSDFSFALQYEGASPAPEHRLPIATVHVTGLTAAFAKYEGQELNKTKVKTLIELTESGMLDIRQGTARFELANKTVGTLKDKIFNFFGKKKADAAAEESGEEAEAAPGGEAEDEALATPTPTPGKGAKPKKGEATSGAEAAQNGTTTNTVETVTLKLATQWHHIAPMEPGAIQSFKARFRRMDLADERRRTRDEARNSLESTIYVARDFLGEEEHLVFLSSTEKEDMEALLTAHSDWLYGEEGEAGTTEQFAQKFRALRDLYDPLVLRKREAENFPIALDSFEETLTSCATLLDRMRELVANATVDDIPAYTANETERFHALLNETRTWLADKLTTQRALAPHQTPVLLAATLGQREGELLSYLKFYAGRKNRKKPVTKSSSSSSSTKADKTATVQSAEATSSPADKERALAEKAAAEAAAAAAAAEAEPSDQKPEGPTTPEGGAEAEL